MSGRRVGQKAFDWIKLASKVPEEAKADFGAFRARHEAYRASLASLPEKAEPIDWDYYRRNIAKPELVDSFQKKFEALSVPYPKDTTSSMLEEQQRKIDQQSQQLIQQAKARAQELTQELEKIKAQKPLDEMTIDEYLEDKPELRKKIETDTMNHVWYLGRD